ncbi:hypothetical protein CDIK_2079 [Cucumispora dikerogammari]|nr:hypothetical protein CDIK_2079 [Cucumispora dikerogammari]
MLNQKQIIEMLHTNPVIFTIYTQNLFELLSVNTEPLIFSAYFINQISNKSAFIRNHQHVQFHQKVEISEGEMVSLNDQLLKIRGLDGIHEFDISGYDSDVTEIGDYLFLDHLNKTVQKIGVSSNYCSNKVELYIPLKKTNKIVDKMKMATLYEIDLLIEATYIDISMECIQNETDSIVEEHLNAKTAIVFRRIFIITEAEVLCEDFKKFLEGSVYFYAVFVTKDINYFEKYTGSKGIYEFKK